MGVGPEDGDLADGGTFRGSRAGDFDRGYPVANVECELETALLVCLHHLLDRAVGPDVKLQLRPWSRFAADDRRAVRTWRLDDLDREHGRLRHLLGGQTDQKLVVEPGRSREQSTLFEVLDDRSPK